VSKEKSIKNEQAAQPNPKLDQTYERKAFVGKNNSRLRFERRVQAD
jgi:hypothetical protein